MKRIRAVWCRVCVATLIVGCSRAPTNSSAQTRATTPSVSESRRTAITSAVAMLSLIKTGMPCIGPRVRPALRSASRRSAIARASGLISRTLCSAGPVRSIASIRARYLSTSERDVSCPDVMRCCRPAMVASSTEGAAGAGDWAVTSTAAETAASASVTP